MQASGNRTVLKELKCPNCGSPIHQHTPNAQTLVCTKCGSSIAIGVDNPSLLEKGSRFPGAPVPISIGDRFKLNDVEFFVLGRVMYRGWDPSEPSDKWVWDEWQLGADDGRILWLSFDDEDGFVLNKKLRLREPFDPKSGSAIPLGGSKRAYVRERYPAKVVGAEGELTFQPKRSEQVLMVEGATGGKLYSLQATDSEIELYEGSRIPEANIAAAMGNQKWLDQIKTREENQKTRKYIGALCVAFAVVALILAGLTMQTGEVVLDQALTVSTANPVVTVPVELDTAGRPAVIKVNLHSSIPVNTYIDADVSVVSPNEKKTVVFSKEFYYETGTDEDGPWSEKKERVSDMFVPYQPGTHYVEVALGGTGFTGDTNIQVQVKKDYIVPGWFFGYGGIVGLIGLVLLFHGGGINLKMMLLIAVPVVVLLIVLALGVSLNNLVDIAFDLLSEL
jgi:ribosomal protein S27AE